MSYLFGQYFRSAPLLATAMLCFAMIGCTKVKLVNSSGRIGVETPIEETLAPSDPNTMSPFQVGSGGSKSSGSGISIRALVGSPTGVDSAAAVQTGSGIKIVPIDSE